MTITTDAIGAFSIPYSQKIETLVNCGIERGIPGSYDVIAYFIMTFNNGVWWITALNGYIAPIKNTKMTVRLFYIPK